MDESVQKICISITKTKSLNGGLTVLQTASIERQLNIQTSTYTYWAFQSITVPKFANEKYLATVREYFPVYILTSDKVTNIIFPGFVRLFVKVGRLKQLSTARQNFTHSSPGALEPCMNSVAVLAEILLRSLRKLIIIIIIKKYIYRIKVSENKLIWFLKKLHWVWNQADLFIHPKNSRWL